MRRCSLDSLKLLTPKEAYIHLLAMHPVPGENWLLSYILLTGPFVCLVCNYNVIRLQCIFPKRSSNSVILYRSTLSTAVFEHAIPARIRSEIARWMKIYYLRDCDNAVLDCHLVPNYINVLRLIKQNIGHVDLQYFGYPLLKQYKIKFYECDHSLLWNLTPPIRDLKDIYTPWCATLTNKRLIDLGNLVRRFFDNQLPEI